MKKNIYKSSSKKSIKKAKGVLNNKWLIIGGVVLIAITGIIAIRISQAALGDYSGRFPEDGSEPHIDYTYNTFTQKVVLKKSTNGETRTVTGIDNAYAEGQVMYDEMIAAQAPPPNSTPSPSPTPAPIPNTNSPTPNPTNPSTTDPNTETNSTNPDDTSTSNNSESKSTGSTESSTKVVKKFQITLRRKVSIVPKIPSNIGKISSVVLLIDGKEVAKSDASNYLIILDTNKISNGEHLLTTQLLDSSGSVVSANSYPIRVDNSSSWVDKLLWFFNS